MIENDTNEITNTNLEIDNIFYGNYGEYAANVKMINFVINNENKFLIVLSNGFISIYKNDLLFANLQTPNLKVSYFDRLKYTQYENTIIFTHPNMSPKKLERIDNNWFFSNLNLINIPVHAFDGEKETIINNVNLTPSIAEGSGYLTSNTSFFTKESVGQIIDGNGGRFRITDYKSETKVFGFTIIPFYNTEAFSNFKYINNFESVWGENRGYPNSCLFYQERLWFGGSKSRPLTLWSSRVNQFNDFKNIGNYDADAINVDLSSRENNEIVNLYGNRGLQIFTGGAEFIASEGSLTPNKIFITQTSSVGSNKNIEPFDIAGITIFIDRKGMNLNSFIYNYEQATYNSNALTLLNNQVIDNPISLAIDYNSNFENGNFVYI